MTTHCMTAREHALRASELLRGVDELDDRMHNLTEDERLQAYIHGGNRQANGQMRFWRDLALAHAQAAMALAATEGGDPA